MITEDVSIMDREMPVNKIDNQLTLPKKTTFSGTDEERFAADHPGLAETIDYADCRNILSECDADESSETKD